MVTRLSPVRLLSRLVGWLCDVPKADEAHSSKSDEMRAEFEPYVVSDERIAEIRALLRGPSDQSAWEILPAPGVNTYDLASAVFDLLSERDEARHAVALTDSSPVVPRGERHG